MKLYEITEAARHLEEIDDPEALKKEADSLVMIFTDKVLHIAKLCREIDGDIAAVDNEIFRLQNRKTALVNKGKWLREYLKFNMEENKMPKISDEIITIQIRKNPASCEVSDVMTLPVEFRKCIPESWQADRVAIIKHFKDTGEVLSGCTIDNTKTHLEIK